MTTITAREFNRDVSAAKRAAVDGPVVVTDRGEPAFVLLSIADYRRRLGRYDAEEFLDRLCMDADDDVEFAPVRFEPRVPEL